MSCKYHLYSKTRAVSRVRDVWMSPTLSICRAAPPLGTSGGAAGIVLCPGIGAVGVG